MSTLFSDNFNRADGGAGANYTDLLGALNVSSNRVVGSGGTWAARIDGGSVPASDCYVEMDLAALPTGADSFSLYLRTNLVSNNGYRINFTSAIATIDIVVAGTPSSIGASFSLPSAGQKVRFEARGSSLLAYYDDTLVTTRTDASYTGGERGLISGAGTTGAGDNLKIGNLPTISAATPSGTLSTACVATIGCTTDDSTGTLYVVVDTASLSGITADQIKAGQNASSAAAVASGSGAVSTSSPSVAVTGLTRNTAYNYAVVQLSGGNSNVLTGTFTTATSGLALVGARGHGAAVSTVSTTAGAVTNGEALVLVVSCGNDRAITSVSLSGSGSDAFGAAKVAYTSGGAKLYVYVLENVTGGASVFATANFDGVTYPVIHLCRAVGVAAACYDAASLTVTTDSNSPFSGTSNALTSAPAVIVAVCEQNNGLTGEWASSDIALISSEPDVDLYYISAIGARYTASASAASASFTRANWYDGNPSGVAVFALTQADAAPAPTQLASSGGKFLTSGGKILRL